MKLPTPDPRVRVAQRLNEPTSTGGLQGSAMPGSSGGAVTNGSTYSQVVAVAGAARVRVRIKTVTATGTLTVSPIAPIAATAGDESVLGASGKIDPSKVQAYTTGTGTASISAATEAKVDVDLYGENYVLVSFAATATGTITFVDISQV